MDNEDVSAQQAREALLPCPWCGNTLSKTTVSEGSTFRWRKVDGCCTDGPEIRHDTLAKDQAAAEIESRRQAIEAWNTRADQNSQPACVRAERMEKALQEIKLRLHFTGWPAEPMWDAGEEGRPRWIADWRYEIDMLENALNGSERRYPERPHSVPRNQLPATPQPAGMDEAVERAVTAIYATSYDGMCLDRSEIARAALTAAGLPALVAECERLRARVDELNRGIGQWSKAYFYVTDILPLDERNLCRDPVCPMNLAEQDRHRVDVLIGERDALREGNRLHDAIVLPATVANERELIDRAEQAEARAVELMAILKQSRAVLIRHTHDHDAATVANRIDAAIEQGGNK